MDIDSWKCFQFSRLPHVEGAHHLQLGKFEYRLEISRIQRGICLLLSSSTANAAWFSPLSLSRRKPRMAGETLAFCRGIGPDDVLLGSCHACWEIRSLPNEASVFVCCLVVNFRIWLWFQSPKYTNKSESMFCWIYFTTFWGHVLWLPWQFLGHFSFLYPSTANKCINAGNIWANATKISNDLFCGTAAARLDRNSPNALITLIDDLWSCLEIQFLQTCYEPQRGESILHLSHISMEIHQNDTCFACPFWPTCEGLQLGEAGCVAGKLLQWGAGKNYFSGALRGNPKEAMEIRNPTALRVEVQIS